VKAALEADPSSSSLASKRKAEMGGGQSGGASASGTGILDSKKGWNGDGESGDAVSVEQIQAQSKRGRKKKNPT
jgi:hypothetical protein